MGFEDRQDLIEELEKARGSNVITYICGDRKNLEMQIGDDAVRPLISQLRHIGEGSKIDLYLYSVGGAVQVPWKIVSLIREYADEFGVLIPYKAHSAATMLALGADKIVLGQEGQLGPIDPALTAPTQNGTQPAEQIRVEDVMSFVDFLQEKAGLGDQSALTENVKPLVEKLGPWRVGGIYRTHSHIRQVARKLLQTHKEPLAEQKIEVIIETLAEKIYFHGHAIGSDEADSIGLPVSKPGDGEDELMWDLFRSYEDWLELNEPFRPEAELESLPSTEDEVEIELEAAAIESTEGSCTYGGTMHIRRLRQEPQQLHFNPSFNVSFPGQIPQNAQQGQQAVQQVLQQVQQQLPDEAKEAIQAQFPVKQITGDFRARWSLVES